MGVSQKIYDLFKQNRKGLVKGPAVVDGTKHLLDDGSWAAVTSTGIAASQAETNAGTDAVKYIAPLTLQGYVNPQLMQRAPRARMGSDGATTNRALIAQFGSHGNVAGSACTFVTSPFTVPTSNPGSSIRLFTLAGSNTLNPTLSLSCTIASDGSLGLNAFGSLFDLAYRRSLAFTNYRSTYSGETGVLVVRFPEGDSTTNPVIYWNGADITSSFSATVGGSAPNWMDASLDSTYFLSAYNWPASDNAPVAHLINYDVGATEALRLSRGEPFAGMDMLGGSRVANYTSSFAVDADGWSSAGGANLVLTGNIDGISGQDDTLRASASANISMAIKRAAGTSGLVTGKIYELEFDYFAETGSTGGGSRYWNAPNTGGSVETLHGAGWVRPLVVENAWTRVRIQWVHFRGDTGVLLSWQDQATGASSILPIASGTSVYFKNMVLRPLGLLDLPIIQPCLATGDALGRFSRRMLGMYPICYDRDEFTIIGDTAAASDVQLLGGPVFANTTDVVLDAIEQSTAGTPSTDIGSAAGGEQYKTNGALSAGINPVSLVTRKVASTSIYVGSSTADRVRTIVRGRRISTPTN